MRIVPQIRRQVPEPWRRTLPLPLAAGLYGVLLGLGFTTFVLTLAVWALAGISVAIGDLQAGLLIGLGFGAGRALPVVLMAPRYATLGQRLELQDGRAAGRCCAACGSPTARCSRRSRSRSSRAAARAPRSVRSSSRPTGPTPRAPARCSPTNALGGAGAVLVDGDAIAQLPAQDVAIGGRYVATRTGERIVVRDRASGRGRRASFAAPGATQLAVSDRWLVWRADRPGGGDRLWALPLPVAQAVPARRERRAASRASSPARAAARRSTARRCRATTSPTPPRRAAAARSSIANLATRSAAAALALRGGQLSQPALDGGRLLYVQSSYCSQRLRVVRTRTLRDPRTLLRIGATARRDEGHEHGYTTQGSEPGRCPRGTPRRTDTLLWTTALAGRSRLRDAAAPGRRRRRRAERADRARRLLSAAAPARSGAGLRRDARAALLLTIWLTVSRDARPLVRRRRPPAAAHDPRAARRAAS